MVEFLIFFFFLCNFTRFYSIVLIEKSVGSIELYLLVYLKLRTCGEHTKENILKRNNLFSIGFVPTLLGTTLNGTGMFPMLLLSIKKLKLIIIAERCRWHLLS